MFISGPHFDLSDDQFDAWAIDLASLTLIVRAYLNSRPIFEQRKSGDTGTYSAWLYSFFFRPIGEWPSFELVEASLGQFPSFAGLTTIYAKRLMAAQMFLTSELTLIGCDLSIAKSLSARIAGLGGTI